jgi:Tfp pilus assembly protein PilN
MTIPAALNLARRPFVNRRPIGRLAIVLWLAGALLLFWNARLYRQYLPGRQLSPEQQQEVRRQIVEQRSAIEQLRRKTAGFDVPQIQLVASFVNQCIAERTFSWSSLFDRLVEAMPDGVRLTSLAPTFLEGEGGDKRGRAKAFEGGDVRLEIRGVAKGDADLLKFIDRLFAHPLFRSPNLGSQRTLDSGEEEFALAVDYHPAEEGAPAAQSAPQSPPEGAPAEPPAPEPAGQDAPAGKAAA